MTGSCLPRPVRERPPAVPEPSQAAVPQTERSEPGPLHAGGRGHELPVSHECVVVAILHRFVWAHASPGVKVFTSDFKLVSLFVCSYLIAQGICYLSLCEASFPKKMAFAYLEHLHNEFYDQYGRKVPRVTRPYSFIEFGKTVCVLSLCSPVYLLTGKKP